MKTVSAGLALLLIFAAAGCGWVLGGSNWDPFASPTERRLAIRVENANRNDMQVRVISGGTRHDLGMIGGRSYRQTSIPWSATGAVRFEIDPIAGRRFTTSGLTVAPGDRVELIIADPVQRSFIRR